MPQLSITSVLNEASENLILILEARRIDLYYCILNYRVFYINNMLKYCQPFCPSAFLPFFLIIINVIIINNKIPAICQFTLFSLICITTVSIRTSPSFVLSAGILYGVLSAFAVVAEFQTMSSGFYVVKNSYSALVGNRGLRV